MQHLSEYISLIAPVSAESAVAEVQARFAANEKASAVGLVLEERPVGLLTRESAEAADRRQTARAIMQQDPLIIDLSVPVLEALAMVAAAPGRCDYFLVRDGDRLVGSGALRDLAEGLRRDGAADPERLLRLYSEMSGPIDSLLAMTALLERQPLGADATAQVRAIREAGEALRRMLRRQAELISAGEDGIEIAPAPLKLRSLIDDIEAEWGARARQSGVTLLLSYEGDPDLTAMADRNRLRQVFDNLIEPALLATGHGAVEVSLKVAAGDGAMRLHGQVRGGGPGLPPEKLARIFDVSPQDPAWLGVAVAHKVVQALNGCIRAESNVGAGVTVSFDLLCPPAVATSDSEDEPAIQTGAAHILIVDDNATNRMVAEALVEMFDCTSECVEDGVEAVEIARNGRFDLILMDIKMPRMDGVAATRAIRALAGPAGAVPIIALTANADPDDAHSYLAAGMCGVVEKPIKPEQLLEAINAALMSSAIGTDRSAAA